MKKRDYLLILLALLGFGAMWIAMAPKPVKSVPTVSLTLTTNAPGLATNQFTFHLKNSESYAFFLSKIFVEEKSPTGWLIATQTAAVADQVYQPGDARDLIVTAPAGTDPWRLRIAYGPQIEGPRLFMIKLGYAFHNHRYPGSSFGAFSGSNSVSSAEISR